MNRQALFGNLNAGIIDERYRALVRNVDRNRELINKFGGLASVVEAFAGKHVVIIGAGPSGGLAVSELKKISRRDDVLFLAVDCALKPLVNNGIQPAWVQTCEATPAGFFDGIDTSAMGLIAYSASAPSTLASWRGFYRFYNWMIDEPLFHALGRQAGTGLGSIATGGTVYTQAVALSAGCGVKSIALVGNDLAFSRQYYVRGNAHHELFLRSASRNNPVETADKTMIRRRSSYLVKRGDARFYTDHQFLAAKMWLEELIPSLTVPVIDCSDPGCSENRVRRMGIKAYIREFVMQGR